MTSSNKTSVQAAVVAQRDEGAAHPLRTSHSPSRPIDKLAPLRNHPLFREFPPSVIEHLGAYMTRRTVRRGATIFAKGERGTTLIAVLWGSVKISVPSSSGQEAVLNIINPGQVFGEIALLEDKPRSATVTVKERVELCTLNKSEFLRARASFESVREELMKVFAQRYRGD